MPTAPLEIRKLSPEQRDFYKRAMIADPWLFSKHICHRDPKAERHHRPLLYLYTRQAHLLAACLSDPRFDGPITDQIQADFERHGIDWTKPEDLPKVQRRIRRLNVRLPRSSGKSTFADDGDLWTGTVDPDVTISIGSKSDPYAWARIETIGKFVLSPEYSFWFPERVPDDIRKDINLDRILLKGRERIVPEGTIEGRGITSQWTGRHYRINRRDDIVGTESGEASLLDALRHMANIDALHDETGWIGDTYIGTVNGENDDHSQLLDDDDVLTIAVGIEEHDDGTTLDNVFDTGKLLLPEWFPRERVDEIKSNARKNKEYGPVALLQNYYMTAHRAGTMLFNRRMVEQAQFVWRYDDLLRTNLIYRPKKGCEKTPRDASRPDFRPQDWFALDLRHLPRTAFAFAVDQSTSLFGDEWAMVLVAIDWEGVFYILKSLVGRGYQVLLDELLPFDRSSGNPHYIGIDANAAQGMTVEWIKRSEEFRSIARRVHPIKSTNERKDVNIRNWLQARMICGDAYVNPKLHEFNAELLKYRPYKDDGRRRSNPVDNQLDGAWMAMTLPRVPPAPETEDEDSIAARIAEEVRARGVDAMTGINSEDWMQYLWPAA